MINDSSKPKLSPFDQLITGFDRALRTVSPGSIKGTRISPASQIKPERTVIPNESINEVDPDLQKHIGGLMRINHTGEVCAQALYQGQALTATKNSTRQAMQQSADEEEDHLAWCEERLQDLDTQTSYLNPLFYAMSFSIGTVAGLAGDRWSLGFIAATEDQVCKHLQDHLEQIPLEDKKSRAVLEQMLIDEQQHGQKAIEEGGKLFGEKEKKLMAAMSKVMTWSTYRF